MVYARWFSAVGIEMAQLIIETPESGTEDTMGGVPWVEAGTRQFLAQLPLSHCRDQRLVARD